MNKRELSGRIITFFNYLMSKLEGDAKIVSILVGMQINHGNVTSTKSIEVYYIAK